MDNRLVIAGVILSRPETRHSPAGIPITRFALRHASRQTEAGMSRRVECTLAVVASGEEHQSVLHTLQEGSSVRVSGFIARGGGRDGEKRLVLHAESIEALNE